jgi:hypothetical protein
VSAQHVVVLLTALTRQATWVAWSSQGVVDFSQLYLSTKEQAQQEQAMELKRQTSTFLLVVLSACHESCLLSGPVTCHACFDHASDWVVLCSYAQAGFQAQHGSCPSIYWYCHRGASTIGSDKLRVS